MKCPYLTLSDDFHCSATDAYYAPSAFELDQYCRSSRFRMCPFYQIKKAGHSFCLVRHAEGLHFPQEMNTTLACYE